MQPVPIFGDTGNKYKLLGDNSEPVKRDLEKLGVAWSFSEEIWWYGRFMDSLGESWIHAAWSATRRYRLWVDYFYQKEMKLMKIRSHWITIHAIEPKWWKSRMFNWFLLSWVSVQKQALFQAALSGVNVSEGQSPSMLLQKRELKTISKQRINEFQLKRYFYLKTNSTSFTTDWVSAINSCGDWEPGHHFGSRLCLKPLLAPVEKKRNLSQELKLIFAQVQIQTWTRKNKKQLKTLKDTKNLEYFPWKAWNACRNKNGWKLLYLETNAKKVTTRSFSLLNSWVQAQLKMVFSLAEEPKFVCFRGLMACF